MHSETTSKPKRKAQPKRRPLWWRLTQLVALAYLSLLIALALFETRLVYPGAYFGEDNLPQATEDRIRTVRYPSTGSSELPGRMLLRPTSQRWVVFFHGNGIRSRQMDGWIEHLSDLADANVMAVEYRGFEDDQTPTEQGLVEDSVAAIDFLEKQFGVQTSDLIFYGQSLGGGVACATAIKRPPAAMILERTFDSAVNVARKRFPWIPISLLMKNRFDSAAYVSNYLKPLVVIGVEKDEVIPIQHAKALYDSATRAQRTWIGVPGLYHNDPLPDEVLRQAFEAITRVPESVTSEERQESDERKKNAS
jgi:uncharacterized protein